MKVKKESGHHNDHDSDMSLSQFITGMEKKNIKSKYLQAKARVLGRKRLYQNLFHFLEPAPLAVEKMTAVMMMIMEGQTWDNLNKRNVNDSHGNYHDSQYTGGMSWIQEDDNYYTTQDTDHGYRPGIEA